MLNKRQFLILTVSMLGTFIIITNYILKVLNNTESEVSLSSKITIQEEIIGLVPFLHKQYSIKNVVSDNTTSTFILNIKNRDKNWKNLEELWKEAHSWTTKNQLYDIKSPRLGSVVYALQTSRIINADIDRRGTQLKLLLTLEDGQLVVFKPKWYPVDYVIQGPVYAGKDRYGSEILSFYLSAILEKPLTAVATERKLSLQQDIVPVASKALLETIFEKDGVTCVYGKCFYCKKDESVCEDFNNTLTGAAIFHLNVSLRNNRSPWQRTYKTNKKAVWESNQDYCRSVKRILSTSRLLNLIDTSIFDFLIQNGDRHHYETLNGNVLLLDNGKGLGNPNIDHIDILAPLYQCCMLHLSTWKRLRLLSGGFLKEALLQMPHIYNIVTEQHLDAIERRLLIVYATVEYCKRNYNSKHIFF